MYSIGELSELAGVSARTLRYYDRLGLLKPAHTNEAGYRFYGDREVNLLQQILFYRERGFDLKTIRHLLCAEDYDVVRTLEEHLLELERQRDRMNSLISLVERSIRAVKGEENMSDKEKFEAFKERAVRENEEKYGSELREKYGDEAVDASQKKILGMSEEDYERFQNLSREVLERLQAAVLDGVSPDSDEAGRIVMLHKEWLGMTWKKYTQEAHRAMANLYISDERFKLYYDREVPGWAELLQKAIEYHVGKDA